MSDDTIDDSINDNGLKITRRRFMQATGAMAASTITNTIVATSASAAEIPDSFEEFWEQERASAFEALCKEEHLDADKLKKVIDRYVYTGTKPLPDPDIIQLINRPLKLAERGPTRKRVLEKVVNYVDTYIHGVAA